MTWRRPHSSQPRSATALTVRLKAGGRTLSALRQDRAEPLSYEQGTRCLDEVRALFVLFALAVSGAQSNALDAANKKRSDPSKTPPELALRAYVDRVRAQHAAEVSTADRSGAPKADWCAWARTPRLPGCTMWSRSWSSRVLPLRPMARSRTPRVERQFQRHRSVRCAQGRNNLQNLVGQKSASGLTAQGQSTTNSSLATTFGGEVVDVLPNGMLVVQATRQLTFSQQTQLIRLRGLVRPEDVSAQNQVLSTAMTDLELEVTGKGIVSDSTYRQNPLVRLLERLLVF